MEQHANETDSETQEKQAHLRMLVEFRSLNAGISVDFHDLPTESNRFLSIIRCVCEAENHSDMQTRNAEKPNCSTGLSKQQPDLHNERCGERDLVADAREHKSAHRSRV